MVGELACGYIKNRKEIISLLQAFPQTLVAESEEILTFIEHKKLMGVGIGLIEQGNGEAFERGFEKIFVLGDHGYYSRFGFVLAKEHNYYCEYDPEGNHFMVLGAHAKEPEKTMVYYCQEYNV
jgi:predicted N-acetyltransferase YhbS